MSIKGLQPGVRAGEGKEEGAESITALGDVMSRWPGAQRRGPSHLQTIPAFIQGPPPGPGRVPGGPGPPCRSHQASQAERRKRLRGGASGFQRRHRRSALSQPIRDLTEVGSGGGATAKGFSSGRKQEDVTKEAVGPLNQLGTLGVVGQESDWLAGRSTWNRGNRWIQP